MPATPPSALPSSDVPQRCDLLVVGGGVNGAGIARDAAGRGLSVVLAEKDDLAAHTSSASTKLIHGGLRYLEHYEFGLVRKALAEREVLLRSAPHIMWPLRFVMPHDPSMRPASMIRLGIWLYDHLARREVLPASEAIRLAGHPAGEPLKPRFSRAFVYSDGWVDDARLVVLAARDAADRGATVLTRTRVTGAEPAAGGWRVRLRDDSAAAPIGREEADGPSAGKSAGGSVERTVHARALVNAAGPWAMQFLSEGLGRRSKRGLRLIRGSHIVVPRLFDHDMAYIFQNADKRIVFAIPYEQDFTLIGTTDVEHHEDPGRVRADQAEVAYLCELAGRCFKAEVSPSDVVWSYSGVRPLLDDEAGDPSAVTRDYLLELERVPAPLLTVWGGKITTFRKLAEEAVDLLAPELGTHAPGWTGGAKLPGGDLSGSIRETGQPERDFASFALAKAALLPWLPAPLLQRWARLYGSRLDRIVGDARSLEGLGSEVAPGLYEVELRYLVREEWARSAEDVAWRRTKLGLRLAPAELARIEDWLQANRPAR
ncbi:glycerol-3-phosphate dehydrogenase [Burkholderiaceae bacterium FT117]|uniref:glycerol-3-phosphate dehydrogenase n=1 Tax=Zeimonas sediminis TaxID=2944268 RepID=UPI002342EC8B|nr:glycerol-3-phosphate dehydrogenase [Zeimonas sediminis]MCM5571748.1 glycerol-3-phosphate dehydrogenase [Zeimonas sediminis]